MKLYIGGRAQGKLRYVLEKNGLSPADVLEGETEDEWSPESARVWNHYHLWFRRKLEQGENPEDLTGKLLSCREDLILISDEVGNGIVPIEPSEREYRERIGRMLCRLAQRAEEVERILCGIGQKIK